ncbi:MAG: RNA degradosome polyphosphate kinase, partial [SAR324 cluster bacterium]|nr:RNA degradosome polyphosphate kinase [SAR324 cluster bacterium]
MCRTELTRQRGILADLVQHQLRPALKAEGIPILDHKDLSKLEKDELNHYFKDSVQPILSPLAVDIGHPFPFISSLALNLAISVHR